MPLIWSRIKERREYLNLSQDELAQKLGYKNRSSVHRVEMGKSDIPQKKVALFAEALNTTPEYLLGLSDSPLAGGINTSDSPQDFPEGTSNKLLDLICGDDVELRKDLASIDTHGSFLNKDGSTAELSENAISTLRYVIKSAVEQAKVTGDKHIRIKSHNKGG